MIAPYTQRYNLQNCVIGRSHFPITSDPKAETFAPRAPVVGRATGNAHDPRFLRRDGPLQADLRCLADDFFAVSFAGFLPSIGISISFWPAAAFRGFFGWLLPSLGVGRSAADAPVPLN